ncbi:uncharacterized protein METZ01_LOCUS466065, partial [marine metagenome]
TGYACVSSCVRSPKFCATNCIRQTNVTTVGQNSYVNCYCPTFTTSGENNQSNILVKGKFVVNENITESGYYYGINIQATGQTDNYKGTLDRQAGVHIQYGLNGTNASAIINCGAGVQVTPYHKDGTITNSRAIWLKDASTNVGGTATNYWGIYQEDSDACNYFAGNVGIGTGAPTGKLEVNGQIVQGSNPNSRPAANSVLIYSDDTSVNNQLVIEQDGSGDASLAFLFSGVQAWQMGMDHSDSNKFKI